MDEDKDTLDKAFDRLKQSRDELKLKMHLGGKEVQDEWSKLEACWTDLEKKTQPLSGAVKEAAASSGEQAKKVATAALDLTAQELNEGYKKLRNLLQ
ncbi:MAG: hypothetical protein L3J39_04870 [Verrucomicrobiales bacterium]|nr:hypothetical protein [Verrucomicrobiales bacterium]